ncbi:hypothetical protein [Polyangium aurulentum]|uniref:hypothetical protein n=1 Tax=Polyangium aurulentum TaxID=2567896 RepID=UPI00146A6AA7|nr:hypothetical protein [Polyangium aurulentum]UQA64058.1 hypothetical protein E8A73_025540 [Polyangium aurulentum]
MLRTFLFRSGALVLMSAALALAAGCTGGSGGGGQGGSGAQGGTGAQGGSGPGGGGPGGAGGQGGDDPQGAGGQGGVAQGGGGQGGGAGGAGGGGGAGGQGGAGGAGGSMSVCNGNTVLAIDHLSLGVTNPDGTPNYQNGWRQYGFNIDGLTSTKDSTDVCKPVAGTVPAVPYPDGNDGKDNSFGKNIMPIISSLSANPEEKVNELFSSGARTYMLSISASGGGSACAATTKLFAGAPLGMMPQFNGTDLWPLDPVLLSNPADPTSATNVFLNSAIDGDTFKSGLEANFTLDISNGESMFLHLPLRHVRLEMKLLPDGAIAGQLGGVMDTEEFVVEVQKNAAVFDDVFCDPNTPTLQGILSQVRQASDIMNDGTQDPTKTCNGISVGLGFTMKPVQLGAVAAPQPPAPDPCAP